MGPYRGNGNETKNENPYQVSIECLRRGCSKSFARVTGKPSHFALPTFWLSQTIALRAETGDAPVGEGRRGAKQSVRPSTRALTRTAQDEASTRRPSTSSGRRLRMRGIGDAQRSVLILSRARERTSRSLILSRARQRTSRRTHQGLTPRRGARGGAAGLWRPWCPLRARSRS